MLRQRSKRSFDQSQAHGRLRGVAEIILLDTGPLVALADRRDQFHEWAQSQLRDLREPMLCCGAVLAEAGFLLRHQPLPLNRIRLQIERGNLIAVHETAASWMRSIALM